VVYTQGLWIFILSSIILVGLILYSLQFRHSKTGQAFLVLMACAAVWTIGFVFETAAVDLSAKILLAKLEFIGITFIPLAWVMLVMNFNRQPLSKWTIIALAVIPVLTNVVIWTNPLHHWFMGTPFLQTADAPFPILYLDYQFWFYFIHAPTGYLYLLVAVYLLISQFRKMDTVYRTQSILLMIAIILPLSADILYVLGFSPLKHYNYTPAIFSISGMILAWALFRYHFLDLIPLARDAVVESLHDGVIVLDIKGRIVDINPAARYILKSSDQRLVGSAVQNSQEQIFRKIGALLKTAPSQVDIEIQGGSKQYYEVGITDVKDQQGDVLGKVITLHDITERTLLFKKVETLAFQDSLTGIDNRRHFISLCKREIYRMRRSGGRPAAVVMIDLDNFKTINDTYGHACGDQVLIDFTRAIQSHLRTLDIFGRVGGEEFALFLVDVNREEALEILERLRVSVESVQIQVNGKELKITASFGMVSSDQMRLEDLEIEKLLTLADQALYRAKEAGRNRIDVWQDKKLVGE
jgi:diguanylate cyclase (GGDEF)-like protein/PAS domain S-box-containing protein